MVTALGLHGIRRRVILLRVNFFLNMYFVYRLPRRWYVIIFEGTILSCYRILLNYKCLPRGLAASCRRRASFEVDENEQWPAIDRWRSWRAWPDYVDDLWRRCYNGRERPTLCKNACATETMVGVVGQCICGLADDAEEEPTRRRRRRWFVRPTG